MQTTTESNNATSNTRGGVGYTYQTSNDDVHFIKHDVLYKQILKNGEAGITAQRTRDCFFRALLHLGKQALLHKWFTSEERNQFNYNVEELFGEAQEDLFDKTSEICIRTERGDPSKGYKGNTSELCKRIDQLCVRCPKLFGVARKYKDEYSDSNTSHGNAQQPSTEETGATPAATRLQMTPEEKRDSVIQWINAMYTQNRSAREKDEAIDRLDKEVAQLKQDKAALQRENAELQNKLSVIKGVF